MSKKTYTKNEITKWPIPNYLDVVALVIVFAGIILLAWNMLQMIAPYHPEQPIAISTNPIYLPVYALRTTLRLFIALFFSLTATFIFGTWAAKSKYAEQLIIPIVDILQSVPVLSFLSITIPGLILIFKNNMLGPECAAIFGIFTSQVWNMVLSFYQGVKTVPNDLKEVANILHLSTWQRFWRIEVPFSMPGLLWNMMMSMSGSWFFVIACEAFPIGNYDISLPGVGSYLALAIKQANNHAVAYAIICMLIVIFLYDQLLFRPLIYWTQKFQNLHDDDSRSSRAWIISLFQQTKLLRQATTWFSAISNWWINLSFTSTKTQPSLSISKKHPKTFYYCYYTTLIVTSLIALFISGKFILTNITFAESKHILMLGIFTGLRVMSVILIASIIWVPIGVWIGLRPRATAFMQPIIQFAAAFPTNAFFSTAAMLMILFKLNVEIWVAPLMILGTQWYILFNVIAGTSALPKELKLVAANFKVTGILWWRRVILPGIAPSFITGAITAAGGAWNASIIAETIEWGSMKLQATGLGSYIQENFHKGDMPRVIAGTIMMCLIVLLINRIFWRPLYNIAIKKLQID